MTNRFGAVAQLEQIDAVIKELRLKRTRIANNLADWETETDDAMTKRLRRNHTRSGMREARFRLNDDRTKPSKLGTQSLPYRAFVLIAGRWRDSGAGFRGVVLHLEDMAAKLGCCKRQLIRVIAYLDKQCGLVVRLRERGKPTRYAVSLPETVIYGEAMRATFAAHAPRLQGLEALHPLADAA